MPATFAYLAEQGLVWLVLQPTDTAPQTAITIQWEGFDYPRRGTYSLSGSSGPHPRVFVAEVSEGQLLRNFTIRSGTISLDVARRFALIGRYELTATDPAGGEVRAHGYFSAGCYSFLC